MLDISQITDDLFISAWPNAEDAAEIAGLGIRLILSMHWTPPANVLAQPPLELLWLPTIDFPLTPIPMSILRRGARAALATIQEGGKVLSHCRAGAHRSVAMGASALIGQGYTADQAMLLIKQKRPSADPYLWYIRSRILKFEKIWRHEQV